MFSHACLADQSIDSVSSVLVLPANLLLFNSPSLQIMRGRDIDGPHHSVAVKPYFDDEECHFSSQLHVWRSSALMRDCVGQFSSERLRAHRVDVAEGDLVLIRWRQSHAAPVKGTAVIER